MKRLLIFTSLLSFSIGTIKPSAASSLNTSQGTSKKVLYNVKNTTKFAVLIITGTSRQLAANKNVSESIPNRLYTLKPSETQRFEIETYESREGRKVQGFIQSLARSGDTVLESPFWSEYTPTPKYDQDTYNMGIINYPNSGLQLVDINQAEQAHESFKE